MQRLKKILKQLKAKFDDSIPMFIIFLLVLIFFVFYLYDRIVYTIDSGQGGVLYRRFFGGTVVEKVYSEGLKVIFPWDKLYIYNVRIQQVPHEFSVLTMNGLKVTLRISIRYYPEYELLGVLHKNVGPDYVVTVVIPEIENVLRVLIGKMAAHEVYTTERAIIQKSLNEAIDQVHQRFIVVDDVIIKRIQLPDSVENAIQYKIEQKHIAEAHTYKVLQQAKEKERKRIEGEGMRDYNDIVNTSLTPGILKWMTIQASLELAKSENSKVVVVGSGKSGLPVFGSMILDAPGNVAFSGDSQAEEPDVLKKKPASQAPQNVLPQVSPGTSKETKAPPESSLSPKNGKQ